MMNEEINQKSNFEANYDKEFFNKLKEAEEYVASFQKKGYENGNIASMINKLFSCIGYFSVIRDKLRDEVIFSKDSLRSLDIQIKRLEKDAETRKSELASQADIRDKLLAEYEFMKEKKEKADRRLYDYPEIQEQYFHVKKRKEVVEESVRKNVIIYQNTTQALELMKLSSEQGKFSLDQGKVILARVERAVSEMSYVYHKIKSCLPGKQEVLQITSGKNE